VENGPLTATPLENEQRLRQADNVLYYMRAGGKESPVLGRLILTNLRIAFAEVLPRKRGLLGISGRGESLRPLINYKISRLLRAEVESRPTIRQTEPGKSVSTEVQELLVVYLNTPTGMEDFAFEVPNPQEWSWAVNGLVPSEAESLPSRSPADGLRDTTGAVMEDAQGKGFIEAKAATAKAATAKVKFCPECGKELDLNTKFCWECGAIQPDAK